MAEDNSNQQKNGLKVPSAKDATYLRKAWDDEYRQPAILQGETPSVDQQGYFKMKGYCVPGVNCGDN